MTKILACSAPRLTGMAAVAALIVTAGAGAASAAIKYAVHRYTTAPQAQKHCPQDEIVYGESKDGI